RRCARQEQRRQDGLEHERRAAGRSDREMVVPRDDFARVKPYFLRVLLRTLHLGAADFGSGVDRGEVLALKSRLGSPSAYVFEVEGFACDGGERKGRPEDLPATFAARSVERQHGKKKVFGKYC